MACISTCPPGQCICPQFGNDFMKMCEGVATDPSAVGRALAEADLVLKQAATMQAEGLAKARAAAQQLAASLGEGRAVDDFVEATAKSIERMRCLADLRLKCDTLRWAQTSS